MQLRKARRQKITLITQTSKMSRRGVIFIGFKWCQLLLFNPAAMKAAARPGRADAAGTGTPFAAGRIRAWDQNRTGIRPQSEDWVRKPSRRLAEG